MSAKSSKGGLGMGLGITKKEEFNDGRYDKR